VPPEDDLHALVAGFADAAAVYDRGRPEYPPAVAARIAAELGAGPGARVVDVGAGTGKLTRPLLATGLDVVGIEPLERMRAALAAAVGPDRALDGRAEALPLADASVDGAVAADAFHWFDGERTAAELHRVVRPGGGVVLAWTVNDDHVPWGDEITALLRPLWERSSHPGIIEGRRGEALEGHGGFAPLRRVETWFEDDIDREQTLAWFHSFSVVGALPEAERAGLMRRFAEILDRHAITTVHRSWKVELHVTRRLAS